MKSIRKILIGSIVAAIILGASVEVVRSGGGAPGIPGGTQFAMGESCGGLAMYSFCMAA